MSIQELVEKMRRDLEGYNSDAQVEREFSPADLVESLNVFQEKHTFQVGDLVTWKPRMQHKTTNGPFVVVDVLPVPIFDKEDRPGSIYWNEPLDIVCGSFANNGCFITFYFDSRRMMPFINPASN